MDVRSDHRSTQVIYEIGNLVSPPCINVSSNTFYLNSNELTSGPSEVATFSAAGKQRKSVYCFYNKHPLIESKRLSLAPLPRYEALFLWLMIQVAAILQSQHSLVLTESATSAQVFHWCPPPGGCLVISSASRCLYSLQFLVVEHMCQVPVGGKKEGEINELPQLQQGQLLKEIKSQLSASTLSIILFIS